MGVRGRRPRATLLSGRARVGLALLVFVVAIGIARAHPNGWVDSSETSLQSSESRELGDPDRPNLCEGIAGIPVGTDPGWVRVGGSPDPETPFVEATGQLLPDARSEDELNYHTNPYVTAEDNPFNHYSKDINAFVTFDKGAPTPPDPYRGLLADPGNFYQPANGEHEHSMLEVEWERGGVPMYAFPTAGDRITVWGPHIFDCGHDSPEGDGRRTEIHAPVGWVLYRNTASRGDRDQPPPEDKASQYPWIWYEWTDRQGIGATLPATRLGSIPVQATVADAFFSTFGGNVPEALNGCDDGGVDRSGERIDAPCHKPFENAWEWFQPLLKQDYTFFVPAPPRPAAKLAFTSHRDDNFEIYAMNPDGSGQVKVRRDPASDRLAVWSPDRQTLAFSSNRDGDPEIYLMDADGRLLDQLTENLRFDSDPAWSPDGGRLAFESGRDGDREIYLMNADGSEEENFTRNGAFDADPAWSPDGEKIAFASDRDGDFEIYLANADGTGIPTPLTKNEVFDGHPSWSPDGHKLAYESESDGDREIYLLSAARPGYSAQVTDNEVFDGDAAWSPDGQKIAFERELEGNLDVYVSNLRDRVETRLTQEAGFDGEPDWRAADARMVWETEDRCSEVPSNPGNPPEDDVEEVGEADDTAENIGAPTCNIPDAVVATVENGQPGIEVTVKATGSEGYPANRYVAFAKRYKVAWEFVPPPDQRVRSFSVDFTHLHVYNDAEPSSCGGDGEWVMSIRVNESWTHPVRGRGDDGDPFWEFGAVNDARCGSGDFKEYQIGEQLTASVVPGEQLYVWERSYDLEPPCIGCQDVTPVAKGFPDLNSIPPNGTPVRFEMGIGDPSIKGAHRILYQVSDVTSRPGHR